MRRRVVRVVAIAAIVVAYCASNLVLWGTQSRKLPPLDGPYPVAKHQWVLQSQRSDPHDSNPFARREFLVNVYYPTLVSDAPYYTMARARYLSPAMTAGNRWLWNDTWFDQMRLRQMLKIQSRAWTGPGSGLSPAQPKYPVIIFSPGAGWFADMHSYYLEQLASRGYVVFAVTHPGQTPLVEYPDGRQFHEGWSADVLPEDGSIWKNDQKREDALAATLKKTLAEGRSPSDAKLQEYMGLRRITRQLPLSVRKDDVIDLLDHVQALNAGMPASQFAGRLDMDNVAVTGMSYGGPTSAEVCWVDARCKVVVNMDGEEYGPAALATRIQPALWLYAADQWDADSTLIRRIAFERYAGPAYRVGFEGAAHGTFADFPFWPQRLTVSSILLPRWLLDAPRVRRERALPPLILEYELDFLDHYLKGQPLRLLNGSEARQGARVDTRAIL